jgi:2'-5' RNA ligase
MKNRFTVQFRGNVDYESEAALQEAIRTTLAQFPEFTVTFSSVEVWTGVDGKARVFNDDGTDYVEPSAVETETVKEEAEPELEEVTGV